MLLNVTEALTPAEQALIDNLNSYAEDDWNKISWKFDRVIEIAKVFSLYRIIEHSNEDDPLEMYTSSLLGTGIEIAVDKSDEIKTYSIIKGDKLPDIILSADEFSRFCNDNNITWVFEKRNYAKAFIDYELLNYGYASKLIGMLKNTVGDLIDIWNGIITKLEVPAISSITKIALLDGMTIGCIENRCEHEVWLYILSLMMVTRIETITPLVTEIHAEIVNQINQKRERTEVEYNRIRNEILDDHIFLACTNKIKRKRYAMDKLPKDRDILEKFNCGLYEGEVMFGPMAEATFDDLYAEAKKNAR